MSLNNQFADNPFTLSEWNARNSSVKLLQQSLKL